MLHQQFNDDFISPNEISSQNLSPSPPPPPPLITTGVKFEYPPMLNVPGPPEHSLPQQNHMPLPQLSPVFSPFSPSPLLTNEIILPSLPLQNEQLYFPEFRQYDKEKYESSKSDVNNCSRRRRQQTHTQIHGGEFCDAASSLDGYDDDDFMNINNQSAHAEMRRQLHIQSEQKRRAEIKDGFDDLQNQLPIPNHGRRKMSKALLLQKTVSHIKNMKAKERHLLDEINRLNHYINYLAGELERERRMNSIYQQKDTLDKLYQIGL